MDICVTDVCKACSQKSANLIQLISRGSFAQSVSTPRPAHESPSEPEKHWNTEQKVFSVVECEEKSLICVEDDRILLNVP
jgi:hypothetical protein